MNNWTIMAPYARLVFGMEGSDNLRHLDGDPLGQFRTEMRKIAGVKLKKGLWNVPLNALRVVNDLAGQYSGITTTAAAWGEEPRKPVDWLRVEDTLKNSGEVYEWVLNGFLTHYQEEALAFGWTSPGVHYWHPTGSGKTLTGLLCSLSVSGPVVVVTRAASRLQYAREIERFLKVRAYVVRPASGGGPIRVKGEGRFEWMARNRHLSKDKNTGLSYSEWSAENKGRYDREEKKAAWAAYKAKHVTKGINLIDAWNAHRDLHGIDPSKSLDDYMKEIDHRPFIVVGWESLSGNIDTLCSLSPGAVIFDECFPPGTPVMTRRGEKPIESVEAGDEVLSLDPETRELQWKVVRRRMAYPAPERGLIEVKHEAGYLTCTPNHQVWVEEVGYVEAGKLLPGDRLRLLRGVRDEEAEGGSPGAEVLFSKVLRQSHAWNYLGYERKSGVRVVPDHVFLSGQLAQAVLRQVVPGEVEKDHAGSVREDRFVYDLEVADNHNYFASGVLVSNSHRGKSTKRWDVVHLPELPDDAEKAAKALDKQRREAKQKGGFVKDTGEEGWKMFVPVLNTASAAARLARASAKRICTTATPVKDRVRDLWAQLDMAEPNAWGNATSFQDRYCDRKPGIYGGYDTRGSSNIGELNKRLTQVAHILAYEETHRQLPKKRRQSVYIAPEDQCRASGGFAKELREARKRGATAVLEVRLAQAASQKRKAVIDMVIDHVTSKHKVVIFTGRRRDCDELSQEVRKKVSKLSQLAALKGHGDVTVWSAHGEQSVKHRQDIIDEYMAHSGPCILVGTGHAFGESLNIHDTDAAFFVMLPYTPGQLRQWEGRFCLAEGQLVYTEQGAKTVECVSAGDWVLSHEGRWCRVATTGSRNLKTMEGGRRSCLTTLSLVGTPTPLQLTADHRVLVSIDGKPAEWVDAGRVCPGDELCTPRISAASSSDVIQVQFPSTCRVNAKGVKNGRYISMPEWILVDEEVAWLMGHFVGDGWTSASTTHYVGLASHTGQIEGHLARAGAVFSRWGIEAKLRSATKGKGVNLYAYSKELALWFRSLFGESSREKRIPSMVFTWPHNLRASFLAGYWDADGHEHKKKGEQQWTTVSPHLALGVFHLASSLGYPVTTAKAASGQYAGSYNARSRTRVDESYVYRKVRTVETHYARGGERKQKVYDLEVTGDSSFCAGGVVVHNCRLGQKRPVVIYYVIAEDTVDERIASILIDKLPAVQQVAQDEELAEAKDVLAGFDPDQSEDEFVDSVLADLDF